MAGNDGDCGSGAATNGFTVAGICHGRWTSSAVSYHNRICRNCDRGRDVMINGTSIARNLCSQRFVQPKRPGQLTEAINRYRPLLALGITTFTVANLDIERPCDPGGTDDQR